MFFKDLHIIKNNLYAYYCTGEGFSTQVSFFCSWLYQTKRPKNRLRSLDFRLFKAFRRVLIEDKAVDSSLSSLFPTTNNGKGSISATLRIQTIYDLLNRCFVLLKLESYCDNDPKASRNILEIAQKDDLILRDRGYFILDVLGEMIEKGIYFLSLWQPSVSILDVKIRGAMRECYRSMQ